MPSWRRYYTFATLLSESEEEEEDQESEHKVDGNV